jgi:hypothetical protein
MSICFLVHPTCIRLLGAGGEDIRVTCRVSACQIDRKYGVKLTSVQDGHGGAAEELTASGTELNLYRQYVSGSPPKS